MFFQKGMIKLVKKLREIIIGNSSLLSNKFKISGNDTDGWSCTLANNITRSNVGTLVTIIGSEFDERIYSPYHANSVVTKSSVAPNKQYSMELNAISLGDIAFVTAPYEMFDTNGKYIKNNSITKMTFVLSIANGGYGYIPSSYAYEYGCYEADTTYVQKGSGEILAKKLVSMISDIEKRITKIEVTTKPLKTNYIQNKEQLDLTGGIITINYNDGTKNTINLTSQDVVVAGFDNTKVGKNTITIKYNNQTTTFDVNIVSKLIEEQEPNKNIQNNVVIFALFSLVLFVSSIMFYRISLKK